MDEGPCTYRENHGDLALSNSHANMDKISLEGEG